MSLDIDLSSRAAHNFKVLKKHLPILSEVLENYNPAALYKFDIKTTNWDRLNVEGPLFIVRCSEAPFYQLCIMEKDNFEVFFLDISSVIKMKVEAKYIMLRCSTSRAPIILGIWIHDDSARDSIQAVIADAMEQSKALGVQTVTVDIHEQLNKSNDALLTDVDIATEINKKAAPTTKAAKSPGVVTILQNPARVAANAASKNNNNNNNNNSLSPSTSSTKQSQSATSSGKVSGQSAKKTTSLSSVTLLKEVLSVSSTSLTSNNNNNNNNNTKDETHNSFLDNLTNASKAPIGSTPIRIAKRSEKQESVTPPSLASMQLSTVEEPKSVETKATSVQGEKKEEKEKETDNSNRKRNKASAAATTTTPTTTTPVTVTAAAIATPLVREKSFNESTEAKNALLSILNKPVISAKTSSVVAASTMPITNDSNNSNSNNNNNNNVSPSISSPVASLPLLSTILVSPISNNNNNNNNNNNMSTTSNATIPPTAAYELLSPSDLLKRRSKA